MKRKTGVAPKPRLFVVGHAGYPFDVLVSIGASDDAILRWLKRTECGELDAEERAAICTERTGKGRTVMLRSGQTILRLVRFDGSPDDRGHLAHEIFHAVEFLMIRIGMRLSEDSDEAFAYAIGNLTKRIEEHL